MAIYMRGEGLKGCYGSWEDGAVLLRYKESKEAVEEQVGWLLLEPELGAELVGDQFAWHHSFHTEELAPEKLYLPSSMRWPFGTLALRALAARGQLWYKPYIRVVPPEEVELLGLNQKPEKPSFWARLRRILRR
jgi:hypothetical protein